MFYIIFSGSCWVSSLAYPRQKAQLLLVYIFPLALLHFAYCANYMTALESVVVTPLVDVPWGLSF
uniref:Uncharacterized protein n=1 Tax=Arundo donax TaxID=35708 RepID=A0A0A8YDC6_ARUDO